MTLLDICQWLYDTPLSTGIRESINAYPMLHFAHILSNSLMFGTIAFLDLRLLGFGLRLRRVSDVAAQILPWTWLGWTAMFVSGAGIFISDPLRYYGSSLFWAKMGLMLLAAVNALIFHSTAYKRVRDWDLNLPTPPRARMAGAISLSTWIAVIFVGRFVGYFA